MALRAFTVTLLTLYAVQAQRFSDFPQGHTGLLCSAQAVHALSLPCSWMHLQIGWD